VVLSYVLLHCLVTTSRVRNNLTGKERFVDNFAQMFLYTKEPIVHFRIASRVNPDKVALPSELAHCLSNDVPELELASFFERLAKHAIVVVIREFLKKAVDQEFYLRVLGEVSDIDVVTAGCRHRD